MSSNNPCIDPNGNAIVGGITFYNGTTTSDTLYDTTTTGGYLVQGSTAGNTVTWNGVGTGTYGNVTYNSPISEVDQLLNLISDGVVTTQQGVTIHIVGGKLHRENGPAYIDEVSNIKRWYIKGKELTKQSFSSIEKVNKMEAWDLFDPVEIVKMKIHGNAINEAKGKLNQISK